MSLEHNSKNINSILTTPQYVTLLQLRFW